MKITITYKIPTTCGNWREYTIEAGSKEKAEEIRKACKTLGFTIKDVTRE